MAEMVLKILGMVCATIIAYTLAIEKDGTTEEAHPFLALLLELIALAIIFLS